MTSLKRESKFYGTSRSVGELKICLHLGLGVGLWGKLKILKFIQSVSERIYKSVECEIGL